MNPKNKKKLKAFILAAGFGSRLKDLTKTTPKPLLPFMNQPMLFHVLEQIEKAGIEEVCVNAHYKWKLVNEALKKHRSNLKIKLSVEKEILGTGGGLASVSHWRQDSDLFVVNADVVHAFNLQEIITQHYRNKSELTLALTEEPHPNEQKIWCSQNKVCSLREQTDPKQTAHGFACIHIISNKVLSEFPSNKNFSILEVYRKMLEEEKTISTYVSSNYWVDMGTPEKYLRCLFEFAKRLKSGQPLDHPAFDNHSSALTGYEKIMSELKKKYPKLLKDG